MKFNQSEHTENVLPELIKHIRKDSDMPELSAKAQKDLWMRIDHSNKYHDRRFVRLLVWSGSIAASICLLVVTGWYVLSSPQPATLDYAAVMQSFKTTENTSENVRLVLSNNQKITIEGKEAQLEYEEEGWVNINNNAKIEIEDYTENEKEVFNQLIVPADKRSMLTFSDGTTVWINSGSKLVYPIKFDTKKREIFVDGEIYLNVSPDPERPFIVRTSLLDVKVLGTQFNVYAYADQPDLRVVLVSGEVEIQQNGTSKKILAPNQMLSYTDQGQDFSVSTVDVSDYIAWKDGYYPFYHQDLSIVLAKLSKYYGVQFSWNDKVRELSCSGKLDLKENLQEVLTALEKTAPIEIRKTSEREYIIIVKP